MASDSTPATTMNGSTEKHLNGKPIKSSKKPRYRVKSKSNAASRISSNVLRLLLWSSILYVFFRCPTSPSELAADDTAVCKQYVNIRSHLAPHVQPHYDAYVKPYVEKVQPHVDRFNEHVYAPAADFAVKNYDTYAAPRASQAQKYIKSSWNGNVQPLLLSGQHRVTASYDQNLSPHVAKVNRAINPYISKAKDELHEVYDGTILPLYSKTRPHVEQAYNQGHQVVNQVLLPHFERARMSTSALFFGRVWPTLVILYGENVEPQVMRIAERLGRYKDSKKLEAVVDVADVSASITSAAASASSVASAASASIQSEQPLPTVAETPLPEETKDVDQEAEMREKIAADLKRWQDKFAIAAEKGAKDLEERVDDITARQMKFQANAVGEALVVQLDNTINSSFKDLKTFINMSISKLPSDAAPADEDVLVEKLNNSIRSTGEKIRSKALAIKNWRRVYDNETVSLVNAALESTLEVIDNIRDLGLQEMGMRWAYMEGVTYKDWSKYHELKKTFDEWRNGVEAVALQHQGLLKAKKEGEIIQDKALDVAAGAAKELIRLQSVISWKVMEHDSSEDFSSKEAPSRKSRAAPEKSILTPAEPSAPNYAQAESQGAAKVWGGAMAGFVEGKRVAVPEDADDWTDQVSSVASQASSAAGSAATQAQAALSSISAAASLRLADGLSRASAQYTQARIAVGLQPPPLHEQYLSSAQNAYYAGLGQAHDQYTQFVDAASSAVYGTPTPYIQSVASEASEKVFGTPEPSYKSLMNAATDSYSSAVSVASARLVEVQKSASSMMGMQSDSAGKKILASASSQYTAAFTAASVGLVNAVSSANVAFYGTEPSWSEVAASKASENYEAIISKASEKIYGTPTPYAASLYNQAGEYAAQATDAAALRYANLQQIVSELVVGKEPDFTESVMNRLSSAYYTGAYDAAASASSIVSVAYDSASSVISSVFTPPAALEGIIDSASLQYQSAVDAASAQIYGTTKGTVEKASSAVSEKYASAQSAASEAIYGTQPSYLQAVQSNLEAAASSAQKAASEAIYGTPTGTVEAAASSAAGAYSYATSVAGDSAAAASEAVKDTYSSVSSQISRAVYGPEYGTWESASLRIAAAAASASAQIAKMYEDAGAAAAGQASGIKDTVQSVASSVSSVADQATKKIKDEL